MKKTSLSVLTLVLAASLALPPKALAGLDRNPEVTDQVAPEYPFSLRLQSKKGEVTIEFDVETDGSVSHPEVVKSSHPDFEAPAVEAVLQWKFKPGLKDGQPVKVHMQVPMLFQLTGMPDGSKGWSMWKVPKSAPKNFPAQFQYDDAPTPLVTSAPVYPLDLLQKKVWGKASVTFVIDPSGRPRVLKILSASNPEFGAATAAMVEAWTFDPAQKDGKPSWALLRMDQDFNSYGDSFPMNDSAERLLKDMRRQPCPIVANVRALDSIPKGRYQPAPVVPTSVEQANKHAEAVIEFVIDHAGHAQLPRVVSATDPDFGWAAATAVARWQFTPPTRGGKPVDIFARIPLAYNPEKQATAGP
jgi:TonB family protein